jgi:serine/threonine protein phosphatase PrpC
VTGAYQIGKHPDSCEDAYFISDRGFGVADGVSGWNDYGFSSSLFSNQLMSFSNEEIKNYIEEAKNNQKSKKSFSKLKKSSSYLSMENLDLNEEEEISEEDKVEELPEESTLPIKSEQVSIDPTFILNKAFQRVTAVGSSTALVAIRN